MLCSNRSASGQGVREARRGDRPEGGLKTRESPPLQDGEYVNHAGPVPFPFFDGRPAVGGLTVDEAVVALRGALAGFFDHDEKERRPAGTERRRQNVS